MLDFKEFAPAAYQVAVEKGWHEGRDMSSLDVRNGMLALIASEISEALECIRKGQTTAEVVNGKPVGLCSEVADVVIRACDFEQASGFDINVPQDLMKWKLGEITPLLAGSLIYEMHLYTVECNLGALIALCYQMADAYGFDLDEAILLKHEYNKTREYKHGGKLL